MLLIIIAMSTDFLFRPFVLLCETGIKNLRATGIIMLICRLIQTSVVADLNAIPNVTIVGNTLTGIYCIAANNVWAVGTCEDSTGRKTLVEHWDRSHWTANKPTPQNLVTGDKYLKGVAAFSPTNIWAVGMYFDFSTTIQNTLIYH